MFSQKSFLIIVALLLTFVNAIPTRRDGRLMRRQCRQAPAQATISAPEATSTSHRNNAATTSSARRPESSSTSEGDNDTPSPPAGGQFAALFPKGTGIDSWSTAQDAPGNRPLSDATFRPTRLMQALSHDYVNAHGKRAMKAHYPRGSFAFRSNPLGGLSFYAPGPREVDLTTAKEVTFGYSVFFEDGFQFNHGGKLPGLYGGNSEDQAIGCSGGRRDDGCFSARLMWRDNGQGELYTYLPPSFAANKRVCNLPPHSDCNAQYGASVGRDSFDWRAGQWTTVTQRLRLNDVGESNGQIELSVNGKTVIRATGLVLRNTAAGRIRGIQMQTFFGGHSSYWQSPRDQNAFFSDFTMAIIEKL